MKTNENQPIVTNAVVHMFISHTSYQ